jgi:hypothetical protein
MSDLPVALRRMPLIPIAVSMEYEMGRSILPPLEKGGFAQ